MLVPAGPIALARRGWGLKGGTITSVVAQGSEGRPDVLCAQMICGAAFSGVKVLVLLSGGRGDDPAWQAIGELLGGGNRRTAAENLAAVPLLMYASGTGKERAAEAELVYAPGLQAGELEKINSTTDAAVLTSSGDEGDISDARNIEVIRVGGDFVVLDAEGIELPMTYDSTGPVYRPVLSPMRREGAGFTT